MDNSPIAGSILRLYIAGKSPISRQAEHNLKHLRTLMKVEAEQVRPSLVDAGAPVLTSFVRDRTAVERAFGRGIPRYLGDYIDVFEELAVSSGMSREVTV